MYEKFRVVGLSYRQSLVDAREMVSLTDEESRHFLRTLREVLGLDEAMVISTCNRTEIYYSREQSAGREIVSLLLMEKGHPENKTLSDYFVERDGLEAIRHLYEVALGLDARVLGDIQISNQAKRAYQAAAEEQMAGPFLHRLMHSVFYANKRVTQETVFKDGAASTAYASVELAEQVIANFKHARILVLGLGEIGSDVAGNLAGTEAAITLSNRTWSKAEQLAVQYNFEAIPYDQALSQLDDFDVIISSVAVEEPVIVRKSFDLSRMTMKLLIDLSIPRSIDQEVETIPGVLLYNVDQLEQKTGKVRQQRELAIPGVRAIIDECIDDLQNWAQELEISPTIHKLKQALEDIRQEELARYLKHADEQQVQLVDKVTRSMLQKVIKLPVLQLKAACKRGEAETLMAVLNDLFNLEKEPVTSPADNQSGK